MNGRLGTLSDRNQSFDRESLDIEAFEISNDSSTQLMQLQKVDFITRCAELPKKDIDPNYLRLSLDAANAEEKAVQL